MAPKRTKRNDRSSCLLLALTAAVLGMLAQAAAAWFIPKLAWQAFGAPAESLNEWQRFSYGMTLALKAGEMTQPVNPQGAEKTFVIQPDESVTAIATRLEAEGLIRSASTFRTYLVWTGAYAYANPLHLYYMPAMIML
jgi:hypothetical protein